MWSNFYIQLFVVAIVFLIGLIVDYNTTQYVPLAGFYVALSIPILMMLGIGYFGFYKFWKEQKNKL